ncbi:endonuclease [Methanofollis aquaemaris]|uniref:Endonuclease n=1 Tax=Methanofollis aquaemaris TaxID=126734 RepID=A0A8A3S4Y9_9EURY|nr:Z1 domain-containing protein [Methanofollis aquaemaris]QSZ66929.1 endonuclease [Methanofollis aquaemaris]
MNDVKRGTKLVRDLIEDKIKEGLLKREDIAEAIEDLMPVLKKMFDWDEGKIRDTLQREVESQTNTWLVENAAVLENDENHAPWLDDKRGKLNWEFWNSYIEYLQDKGWSGTLIENLDNTTDNILRRLEDPVREGNWDRRGMVVGEIQSGKTSNYIGLACKAFDAEYKLVIILAGIHNSLRSQTQIRVNEGIIGSNTISGIDDPDSQKRTGVGLLPGYDYKKRPGTLTSIEDNGDFSKKVMKSAGIKPGQMPLILVVKKNVTSLKNIKNWALSEAQRVETGEKILRDVPLLLIDDEADNASIDTNKIPDAEPDEESDEEYEPTRINGLIRGILHSFEKSSYVGYTATPFANIFIYPVKYLTKYGRDLFPRNFIISLPTPSNYIGPEKVFGFDDDPETGIEGQDGLPLVIPVHDSADYIPSIHKSDHYISEIPESLKKAVKYFILSCTARTVRGHPNEHNSMLVHVTRYINVQTRIGVLVESELRAVQQKLKYGTGRNSENILEEFHEIWETDFVPVTRTVIEKTGDAAISEVSWDEIKEHIVPVALKIRIIIANSSSKDVLEYRNHEKVGLSAIIIGGDRLSRGLTLEGLTISYYLRSTHMYDTLMQMGRWFGYRPGYLDLCRIFTTSELIECYRHIALAGKELREEFIHMADTGATPEDYGLRVRTHPGNMIVTSVNKMRYGEKMRLSYAGTVSESVVYFRDRNQNEKNIKSTGDFITELNSGRDFSNMKKYYLWRNIPAEDVISYMDSIKTHPHSYKANSSLISKYIKKASAKGELTSWTIVLMNSGNGDKIKIGDYEVKSVIRSRLNTEDTSSDKYTIRRLISTRDEWLDMDEPVRKNIMAMTVEAWKNGKIKSKEAPEIPSGRIIREKRDKSSGLLLIYPVDLREGNKILVHTTGFAVSFPYSKTAPDIEYIVNKIYWDNEVLDGGY